MAQKEGGGNCGNGAIASTKMADRPSLSALLLKTSLQKVLTRLFLGALVCQPQAAGPRTFFSQEYGPHR